MAPQARKIEVEAGKSNRGSSQTQPVLVGAPLGSQEKKNQELIQLGVEANWAKRTKLAETGTTYNFRRQHGQSLRGEKHRISPSEKGPGKKKAPRNHWVVARNFLEARIKGSKQGCLGLGVTGQEKALWATKQKQKWACPKTESAHMQTGRVGVRNCAVTCKKARCPRGTETGGET